MSIEAILSPILAKLSGVSKHQRTFLTELFSVLLGRQGRATFENLARYSRFTELTFRRQFSTFFDSDSKGVDAFEIVVPDKKLCRKLMKHIGLREG